MRVKVGVSLAKCQPPTAYAMGRTEAIYKAHGQLFIVTSGDDGVHTDTRNIHGNGWAFDARTNHIPNLDTRKEIYLHVKQELDPLGYDIIHHEEGGPVPPHLHVEYDPKVGESWTQEVA